MKIAGSTRASLRLMFQCMCGPVARPVEPTLPTTATTSSTDVPKTDSTTSARSDFTDYMKKSPAERINA